MRLISKQASEALNRPSPINFSLYFNKMLEYGPELEPLCKRAPLARHEPVYKRSEDAVAKELQARHVRQSRYCRLAESQGCRLLVFHVRLRTPYVSGLGMAHPGETGMVLDHTLGVPYLPAAGQKGSLRLAWMLGDLRDENGDWLPLSQLATDSAGNPLWSESADFREIFGFSEKQSSQRGSVQILDAYPVAQPRLQEDILNPHFADYYRSQGKESGPSEDQSPVPVKFIVVAPGGKFIFRLLIRPPQPTAPLAISAQMIEKLLQTMRAALTEEGFGAKTSQGYGLFEILGESEPEFIADWETQLEKRRQERDRKRQDIINPWRPLQRKIEGLDNWGQLKTLVLENSESEPFKNQPEFVGAVNRAALAVKAANPKKWTPERDRQVVAWFEGTDLSWAVENIVPESENSEDCSERQQLIQTFADWGVYKQSGLELFDLTRDEAEALKVKFDDWKIRKSGKKDKEKAYKDLSRHLRELK